MIPQQVLDSLTSMALDGLMVAGLVLLATVALFAFRFMRAAMLGAHVAGMASGVLSGLRRGGGRGNT